MKWVVGWRDRKTNKMKKKGALTLEAKSEYAAKADFLDNRCKGTPLETVLRKHQLTLVTARSIEDGRRTDPLPKNFDLDAFIDEFNREEVPA